MTKIGSVGSFPFSHEQFLNGRYREFLAATDVMLEIPFPLALASNRTMSVLIGRYTPNLQDIN